MQAFDEMSLFTKDGKGKKKKTSTRGYNDASSSVFSNFFSNFSNFSNWAGLKYFYSHFRSGFTIIYGENYAFLSLLTKALPTDGRTDGHTLL